METKSASSSLWWLKSNRTEQPSNTIVPRLDLDISSSLADFLEKEQNVLNSNDLTEVDVGSIIEEINRVAAQSPLGPYDKQITTEERSIEEIMKEAERVYMESSKSFEQLSQRSKTSQNITELSSSKESTPSPKSISPLPNDEDDEESYSEDFSEESKIQSVSTSPIQNIPNIELKSPKSNIEEPNKEDENKTPEPPKQFEYQEQLIKTLEDDNKQLRIEISQVKNQIEETNLLLIQTKSALSANKPIVCSPELNIELEKTLEELKDSREKNTSLQLQLDTINKTHSLLKNSYDELYSSNTTLERRVSDLDLILAKYKSDIETLQLQKDKLQSNEANLMKMLQVEKLQAKNCKMQNEKDAKSIQDLTRQVKEMERIIARKHPDSVSALIVAAKKEDETISMTARKILEDRIKVLEEEAMTRDSQSSRIFIDIQDKFNQMKCKYESHIEDLELHVSDLKKQLKQEQQQQRDTFDVYTQTTREIQNSNNNKRNEMAAEKEMISVGTQTSLLTNFNGKKVEVKEKDTHLLATIRGLQADLTNKEKVLMKLNREMDELRKTNRKLQKEREGSLRSLNEQRKEFRSYPEKLALQAAATTTLKTNDGGDEEDVKFLRCEKDKMKLQLCRIEEDYQNLKTKRIQDLTALQEAHEREMADMMANVQPLREQIELQQVSLQTVQNQLAQAKEDLLILQVERDHLNEKMSGGDQHRYQSSSSSSEIEALEKKIQFLENRYEEREIRLKAIVHGLAQKQVTNKSCEQCAERQKQLIGYKNELDQLLATIKSLK